MINAKSKGRGFTLIELLVVITIIGLLATFSTVSLNSARIKARDARRLADISQVRLALYLYYDDNNGFPATGGGSNEDIVQNWNNILSPALNGTSNPEVYMGNVPTDPLNRGSYRYGYSSDGINFEINYALEQGGVQELVGN